MSSSGWAPGLVPGHHTASRAALRLRALLFDAGLGVSPWRGGARPGQGHRLQHSAEMPARRVPRAPQADRTPPRTLASSQPRPEATTLGDFGVRARHSRHGLRPRIRVQLRHRLAHVCPDLSGSRRAPFRSPRSTSRPRAAAGRHARAGSASTSSSWPPSSRARPRARVDVRRPAATSSTARNLASGASWNTKPRAPRPSPRSGGPGRQTRCTGSPPSRGRICPRAVDFDPGEPGHAQVDQRDVGLRRLDLLQRPPDRRVRGRRPRSRARRGRPRPLPRPLDGRRPRGRWSHPVGHGSPSDGGLRMPASPRIELQQRRGSSDAEVCGHQLRWRGSDADARGDHESSDVRHRRRTRARRHSGLPDAGRAAPDLEPTRGP